MDPNQALDRARKESKPDDLILVCGSFYLAGELRKNWFDKEYILKNRKS